MMNEHHQYAVFEKDNGDMYVVTTHPDYDPDNRRSLFDFQYHQSFIGHRLIKTFETCEEATNYINIYSRCLYLS